jgi:hypothetical protein
MLISVDLLRDCKVAARDGELGSVRDVYFDDHLWTVRYLVLETGGWLSGREVLISPVSARRPDLARKMLPVDLTKAQIEQSPPVDSAMPVSREQEAKMTAYFSWPSYWGYAPAPAEAIPPFGATGAALRRDVDPESRLEPQLRSVQEVTGYSILATDAQLGHVEDFLVEVESWKIRYMVVDTRALLPGKKVLVAPLWIDRISWSERAVRVDLSADRIRSAPAFDKRTDLTREYERALFAHYNRPGYW